MAENVQPVYVTAEGLLKLREEMEYLCRVRRPEVAQLIAEAKADGDISENAGYDEAKNEQAFVEGRILTLEAMLRRAEIIENGSSEFVALGSRVTIRELGTNEPETYMIVGSAEADPTQGRISNVSPMGKALMNKTEGDKISVETPGGELLFEILGIEAHGGDQGEAE